MADEANQGTCAMVQGDRIRSLAAALASAFGVGVTLGMATPLISLVLEAEGHGSVTIGLVAASYSAALLVTGPVVPGLAGRLGPVTVMCMGMAVSAIALVLFPLAAPVGLLFSLRALMGAGCAMNWVVSETWVNSLASEHSRGKVVGLYATVWGGGLAVGPAILSIVGTQGARPFLLAAAMLAIASLPLLLAHRIAPRLDGGRGARMLLETLRTAPLIAGAAFTCGFAETAFVSLYPVHATLHSIRPEIVVLQVSIGAAGSLALQQPFGWLADRLDRKMLLAAVAAIAVAAAALLPAALDTWAVWPLVFLMGGAIAGFYTLGLVLLGQRFASGDLAGANTGFIMSYTTGMVAGPVLAGAGMRIWPGHGLIIVLGTVFSAYLAACVASLATRRG